MEHLPSLDLSYSLHLLLYLPCRWPRARYLEVTFERFFALATVFALYTYGQSAFLKDVKNHELP